MRIDQAVDRVRRPDGVQAERRADVLREGAPGRGDVEGERAAGEILQVAENGVGVADRRFRAATPVTDGAGLAGALRPDVQRAASSSQAIEPPPAPILRMSSIGVRTA